LVPVAAVLLAAVVGALVMALTGTNPVFGYDTLIRGALAVENLDYTIAVFTALLAMTMAFALPFRMGEYNLGGDGQLAAGAVLATVVGLTVPGPAVLLVPLALAAGAVGGGLVCAISAPLVNRLGVPVIISTLLLSTPVTALVSYLVRYPLADRGTGVAQTAQLPDAAHLPALGELRYTNVGVLLVIGVLVAVWVVDARTSLGYELRIAGHNRAFAAYGGVSPRRLTLGTLAVSGAVAGLAGAIIVMSPPFRLIDGALTAPGYTFAGVAAALLAGGRPVLLPVTVALFTILQAGSLGMERDAEVPHQLAQVIQASIIIPLALRTVLRWRANRRQEASA